MSTNISQMEYIADQLQDAGAITYRKMFGEYALYCDAKVVGLICDNQLFVKPTRAGKNFVGEIRMAPPYPGARHFFAIDEQIDNREWLGELIKVTAADLPLPKAKKPRQSVKKRL